MTLRIINYIIFSFFFSRYLGCRIFVFEKKIAYLTSKYYVGDKTNVNIFNNFIPRNGYQIKVELLNDKINYLFSTATVKKKIGGKK